MIWINDGHALCVKYFCSNISSLVSLEFHCANRTVAKFRSVWLSVVVGDVAMFNRLACLLDEVFGIYMRCAAFSMVSFPDDKTDLNTLCASL